MEYLLITTNVTLFSTQSEKLHSDMQRKDFVKHHKAFKCS